MITADHFAEFRRADATEGELRAAAVRLGPVKESPSVWSDVANEPSLPDHHRRLAVVQLVRRHVIPGQTTTAEFATMLAGAPWLETGDITLMTALAGKIPVQWSAADTVAAITLPGNEGAIYLSIAGSFSAQEIADALHGLGQNDGGDASVILDVGLMDSL